MNVKQIALKPQDLLVSIKIALMQGKQFTYGELATQLFMSASEVHGAVKRAEMCRLLAKSGGEIRAIPSALEEFLVHGIRYTFPPVIGPLVRGIPTGAGGPVLRESFLKTEEMSLVWPDPQGDARGISLQPVYPSVPSASRSDPRLYAVLTLVDSLRAGAARERELASSILMEHLT